VFAPDGGCCSPPPAPPEAAARTTKPAALWLLPPAARRASSAAAPAAWAPSRWLGRPAPSSRCPTPAGATDGDSDAERRAARKDARVDAVLHTGYPVRYWDRDPRRRPTAPARRRPRGRPRLARPDPRARTGPARGRGSTSPPTAARPVVTWSVAEPRGSRRNGPGRDRHDDRRAHDAVRRPRRRVRRAGRQPRRLDRRVPARDAQHPQEPIDLALLVVPVDGSGEPREVTSGWDLWPGRPDVDARRRGPGRRRRRAGRAPGVPRSTSRAARSSA
jgi:hypothetical protein